MMPGGSAEAYKHIQAIVEKVAAQVLPSCMLQLFRMPQLLAWDAELARHPDSLSLQPAVIA